MDRSPTELIGEGEWEVEEAAVESWRSEADPNRRGKDAKTMESGAWRTSRSLRTGRNVDEAFLHFDTSRNVGC